MSRKFITLVTAASIAVAGLTANQAEASDKRTRNFLLGVTALAIIGAAIADNDKKGGAYTSTHNPYPPRPRGHDHNDHHSGWNGHGHGHNGGPRPVVTPRPVPPRVTLSELPQRCVRHVADRSGPRTVYETTCVQRHYKYAGYLPESCRNNFWSGGTKINGYTQRCLINTPVKTPRSAWVDRR